MSHRIIIDNHSGFSGFSGFDDFDEFRTVNQYEFPSGFDKIIQGGRSAKARDIPEASVALACDGRSYTLRSDPDFTSDCNNSVVKIRCLKMSSNTAVKIHQMLRMMT